MTRPGQADPRERRGRWLTGTIELQMACKGEEADAAGTPGGDGGGGGGGGWYSKDPMEPCCIRMHSTALEATRLTASVD